MDGFLVDAPPLPPPVWVEQFWGDLTFLHWPVDPATVAHLYPPGTAPDVFADGLTYVGLVPFVMHSSTVAGRMPLPYFGNFAETNVRLYSVDAAGRHGVVFRSLETARLAVVGVTRLGMGVPYTWARLRVTRSGDRITYAGTRRWPERGLRTLAGLTIGAPVDPTPLEVWLTARWGAHTRKAGRTWWIPNEHPTWPLQHAELVELHDDLVPASGVAPVGPPLRALFSPGVRARFGRPVALS
jgi:uncharacterized protein